MSNLTDKTSPKLPSFPQNYNSRETPSKDLDVENNFYRLGLNSATKNPIEAATDIRKKVNLQSKIRPHDETEHIKTLKNALREAMDENDRVYNINISFFFIIQASKSSL